MKRNARLAGALGAALLVAAGAGAPKIRAAAGDAAPNPWWKHALIYEVYPRSFQDSNGDGIGDLNGITSRLQFVHDMGYDAIWLSPMYPSPQVDFGYDISDYEAVDPKYGTLADFDKMLAAAKEKDIRVCLDFVINHTSDKHKWFIESESSRTSPKRDWYIWRDPKGFTADGKPIPPNNWISEFGGSAWKYDPKTKQFYYHRFYVEQPDLNWRNPEVEKAMFGVIKFWLDRGVAGFRLDAVPTMYEDPNLTDAKILPGKTKLGDPNEDKSNYDNLPEVHGAMQRLRALVNSYPGDRVLIGETYLKSAEDLNRWYGGAKHDELQLPMDLQVGFQKKLDAGTLRQLINDAETKIDGNQPLFVFDNHDNPRSWDRLGDGAHDAQIARVVAAALLTSKASALMYYGEELGMYTATPKRKEDVQDPVGRSGWPTEKGRDGERTPMQWTPGPQAGFSTDPHTWLPVESDYKTINVDTEAGEKESLLNWYRQLISMRRYNPVMHDGAMSMLDTSNPSVLSWMRKGVDGKAIVVAMNCTPGPQTVSLESAGKGAVKTLLTDAPELAEHTSLTGIALPAYGTWIASVQ